MRLVSLNCNQCGAPLEVPEKIQFVTCVYCSARLSIHRSGNAVYSESLDEIEKRTGEIAEDLETIKLQNELESLDRQWMLDRDRYQGQGTRWPLQRARSGRQHRGHGIGRRVWRVLDRGRSIDGCPGLFPLFGIVFVIVAIVGGIASLNKAEAYQRNRKSYEVQRKMLLHTNPRERRSTDQYATYDVFIAYASQFRRKDHPDEEPCSHCGMPDCRTRLSLPRYLFRPGRRRTTDLDVGRRPAHHAGGISGLQRRPGPTPPRRMARKSRCPRRRSAPRIASTCGRNCSDESRKPEDQRRRNRRPSNRRPHRPPDHGRGGEAPNSTRSARKPG